MRAIILAGGMGTRLRPLTLSTPKPVVPLLNRPFLLNQIDMARRAGIRQVTLSLSYRPEEVRAVMARHPTGGVKLDYVVEDEPLGTGGGVRYASRGVSETLVVFNGDVLSDLDLPGVIALHRRRRALATIVLTEVENPTAYGLVEAGTDGRVHGFLEKPSWEEVRCNTVNAGIYVLEPELLAHLPDGPCSIERDFFPELVRRGEPFFAAVHRGYWLDIGTSEKYFQAHRDLLAAMARGERGYRQRRDGLWAAGGAKLHRRTQVRGRALVGPGVLVGEQAELNGTVVVGAGCRIEGHVSLEDCVLWDGVTVAEGAKLQGCILARGVHVGAHAHLSGHIVLGNDTSIPDYSLLRGGRSDD